MTTLAEHSGHRHCSGAIAAGDDKAEADELDLVCVHGFGLAPELETVAS